ncbi:MAG: hypothetical protein ACREDU_13210, partial [Methylocella sp.]
VQDHEGRKWVFIEGSETGVPMEQIILERKAGALQSALLPPVLPLEKDEPPPKGARKEITSLDEGAATLIWPDDLSAESVVDLEHWLNGILRKAKRRAGVKDDKKDDAAS